MAIDLRGHQRIGLDSNVLIYLVDDAGELGQAAGRLIDAIAAGTAAGVLSALVLTEVCAGPALAGDLALVERVADDLRTLENTQVVAVSADIAIDAAVIRAGRSVSLADAIHLACVRAAGATAFVTNDRRVKSSPQLEVLYLEEL